MLSLQEFMDNIRVQLGGRIASAFQKIEDAINQTNTANGTDPTQMTEPPHPPAALNIAAGSDHVHLTITDPSQRARALNYFAEWSVNDPAFLAPHVEHLGASRGRVLALPAMDSESNVYNYYFRAYSSTLSAKSASKKVYFGSSMSPTAVTLSGSSTLDLLPSTGAGTAATNGQQAGQGFGNAQFSKSGGPAAP
jgi:hypothetical protein